MPNIKSAIKRVRVSQKQHDRNVAYKSSLKTAIKAARTALNEDPVNAGSCVLSAVSRMDKLSSKGIIHPNAAARKKSRLMKKLYYSQKAE